MHLEAPEKQRITNSLKSGWLYTGQLSLYAEKQKPWNAVVCVSNRKQKNKTFISSQTPRCSLQHPKANAGASVWYHTDKDQAY